MPSFQSQKQTVLEFYGALDTAALADIEGSIRAHTTEDYIWRSYHPFGLKTDPAEIANECWVPMKTAITSMQRRMDVFFAGDNFMDDGQSVWVCTMGHLMGLFDQPWLGIQPNNKLVMLRYAEFHRVVDNKIAETAFYFDIPHLMVQAGYNPFPNQTASPLVQPGPATHDALMYQDADPAESQRTMDSMNQMISDLGQWQGGLPLEEELAMTWHDDMLWWGPAGIGATYTIKRYAQQHSGPFRAAFTDRSKTKHIARIAEGSYSGFFGWPNFTARPTGGFIGMPPSDTLCEFNVIDIYRREGDKLKENWIFIDMLHYLKQLGVDVLGDLNKPAL